MDGRYTLGNFLRAIKNPELFKKETRRIQNIILGKSIRRVQNKLFNKRYGPGIDVMSEDWDNLVLLDACRYDYFKRQQNLGGGDLREVVSRGAHSWEFMKKNFVGRNLHDTVYVTANPHAEKLSDDVFYTVETLLDQWDSELGTVLPRDVVEAAVEANEKYPNKRLIIHFMQPHKPHLGSTADSIRDRVELRGWDKYHGHKAVEGNLSGISLWSAVKSGDVSINKTRQAYAESLDIVLDYTSELVNRISGKTIVSSDHGEMLGEHGVFVRRYGHPHDIYNRKLRIVPWYVIPSDERRDITSEEPIGFKRLETDAVNNRLQALGYAPE